MSRKAHDARQAAQPPADAGALPLVRTLPVLLLAHTPLLNLPPRPDARRMA